MKMDDWLILLKNKKSGCINNQNDLKARSSEKGLVKELFCEKDTKILGKLCNVKKSITVTFSSKTNISIFEASLLYSLFVEKKIPHDYSKYHECEAGKKFIENIIAVKENNLQIQEV